ncbi:MAG: hypothetical protein MAG795_00217 [Candidatus Woesearchaeota archaeon]|nr:hypothetical protein [Candidatus Woesearchaeota archaeon]
MKRATIILVLVLVILGMLMGCAKDTDSTTEDQNLKESDPEIAQELDDTVIENKDLDVGEMI